MRHRAIAAMLAWMICTMNVAGAASRAVTPDAPVAVEGYNVVASPANIASTAATAPAPVRVNGQPRIAKGHPCTLWDQEDLASLKELLKTSAALQQEFARLKSDMDKRVAQPLGVPEPGAPAPTRDGYRAHANNAHVISDLGTLYALTGDAKYGEYCRKMLLAYANGYPTYKHPAEWTERRYRSAQDGRLTGQFLEDGGWLIQVARGYDLVYNLPSWTDAERNKIRDDLFEAIAYEFVADVLGKDDYLGQTHNRSVICNCGVLMAGYASDDQKLINYGLYGKNGTKEKPTGGVFGMHFGPKCIDMDGMWNEGAMGYHFMALGALINDAEVLWRHGMDMYRYRDGALKGLFDSPLLFVYPDLTTPATHDSGRVSLHLDWFTDCHHTYDYAYLRYGDARYLAVIDKVKPHLRLSIHQGPTSAIFERHPDHAVPLPCESANFAGVGYGILRLPSADGVISLLMEYGPSRSHGHPSKLDIDLFAQGDVLLPDPGSVFPYDYPLDEKWYHTTPAHCVLVVDEKPQISAGNRWKYPRNLPDPDSRQLVYGPAGTIGVQRAWSNTVTPGVTQDRALFLTPLYMADLYGAFSAAPHKYDLAWHVRGEMTSSLPLEPLTLPEPRENGYNVLNNVRHAPGDHAWSASFAREGKTVRLIAAAGAGTDVIVADGYTRTLRADEKTPAIFQRRSINSTVYGNAVDFSGTPGGYVKSVTQEGGFDRGYAALAVQTARGTDVCLVSYRPGVYKAAGIETDALQAMIVMTGVDVQSMYLAGGKILKSGGATLTRSEPGLAYIDKTAAGAYTVCNPSAGDATVTVTLPGIAPKTFMLKGGAKAEWKPIER